MQAMRLSCIMLLVLATLPLSAETWDLSTIDDAGIVGQHAAIATYFGTTHVVYYDATNGDLKYAVTGDDKDWKIETVDSAGNVGEWAAIAVDVKGVVHISYYDATNSDLKYGMKAAGAAWKLEVVDSGNVGMYSSIAVDSSYFVYISYMEMAGDNLKCVRGQAGNWMPMLTDISSSVGWGSSMAVDPNKRGHISYNDDINHRLRYATNANGSFDVAVLDPIDVGVPTAIAVDAFGVVHIAYLVNGQLHYAHNLPGVFLSETVDASIGPEEWDLSITTTADGRPIITYHDGEQGMLKLARKNEEWTWTKDTLDKWGRFNSVCVDKKGRIRIAYFGVEGDLHYAIN